MEQENEKLNNKKNIKEKKQSKNNHSKKKNKINKRKKIICFVSICIIIILIVIGVKIVNNKKDSNSNNTEVSGKIVKIKMIDEGEIIDIKDNVITINSVDYKNNEKEVKFKIGENTFLQKENYDEKIYLSDLKIGEKVSVERKKNSDGNIEEIAEMVTILESEEIE